MSRLRTQSAAAGVLLAVLAFAVHFTLPFVAARRAAGHPSVVLISIDTLRADRLGVAGYSRNLTPALDRLADQGAAFLQATSTAPWTFPAHLSLFTSTLPFDSGTRIWRAAPDFLMLAEIFKNAGYRTQAHTGGTWIHARIGFSQGFESFTSHNEIKKGGPASYLAEAAEWIGDGGRVPFFLLLHTYEPHIPYVHGDYADPTAAGLVGETFDVDDLESLRSGKFVPNEVERAYIIDLYDGDVAASDRYVGAFLDRLDQMCAPEDVVVMVLSDHGEDLWDHVPERSADHGHSLYEELLRVPWIVRKAGDVTPGLRIQQPVSLVDVAPTLLELADLPLSPGHTGRSLAKNLLEGTEPPVRSVFAEMVEYGPDRFSVRHHDLKVILTPFPGIVRDDLHLAVDTLEVFDLAQDPLEQSNLGLHDLEATGPLAKMLEQRAALGLGEGGTRPDSDPIPEKLLEEIRALGYTR